LILYVLYSTTRAATRRLGTCVGAPSVSVSEWFPTSGSLDRLGSATAVRNVLYQMDESGE